jgi:hypothetical protein
VKLKTSQELITVAGEGSRERSRCLGTQPVGRTPYGHGYIKSECKVMPTLMEDTV